MKSLRLPWHLGLLAMIATAIYAYVGAGWSLNLVNPKFLKSDFGICWNFPQANGLIYSCHICFSTCWEKSIHLSNVLFPPNGQTIKSKQGYLPLWQLAGASCSTQTITLFVEQSFGMKSKCKTPLISVLCLNLFKSFWYKVA